MKGYGSTEEEAIDIVLGGRNQLSLQTGSNI